MEELYISDLDGTLLNAEQRLSETTVRILNGLIDRGLPFTVATARSFESAGRILAPLKLRLPMVLFNGVFLYDPVRGENVVSNYMTAEAAEHIVGEYGRTGVSPIIFTVNALGEKKVYYRGVFNPGEADFVNSRLAGGDKRFERVQDFTRALRENVISVVAIDRKETLDPWFQAFSKDPRLTCHYSEDIYSKYYWLELSREGCTKRKGVEALSRMLGAERLICFGDHLNDISMFEAADEKYAVANAQPQLKELATGVIGSNLEDGVARFLEERWIRTAAARGRAT